MEYPVEIRADKLDANDSDAICCHVFDSESLRAVFASLSQAYVHVIAFDTEGNPVETYDNR